MRCAGCPYLDIPPERKRATCCGDKHAHTVDGFAIIEHRPPGLNRHQRRKAEKLERQKRNTA